MTENTQPGRTSQWMRWVLVISLALNLLIVGAAAGWMLKGGKHGRHHPSRLDHIGGPMTRALSHEDRHAIRSEMRKAFRKENGPRAQQRALIRQIVEELRKDPFNPEVVAAHMTSQRDILNQRLSLGQSLLLDRLSAMDTAERSEFADRLEDNMKRKHKK